ncbi:intradiol ring-cleavage dioxygenase [Parapusillimonas granuli]|uniref:Intradiol ring-cleavage dioxygenase n=1 Tax=Parapusillimonas granuli TaxID=380911 RepID=A0A853FZQ3_9BURK|nr:intradiol ring-cleavage dioxygenase [Parapusillimonas granuli]MBB5214469.1 hydroxyquinol 1,2-dioxygenase [Parapusillimonas granuli]NYT49122.1 intradiol ring-cleavage dioxygenase [Parapusillimonas granuli]
MINLDENTITQAVIDSHANASNPRLQEIMTSLVRHLHAFARDVDLTEAEWKIAIDFLTAVGQKCSTTRQEFILLSDTLGLSTLVTAQNHRHPPGHTEATVFGPFHVPDAPEYQLGDDIAQGMAGKPCFVQGAIRTIDGTPIAAARIEVWQADAEGFYDVQRPELKGHQGRGVLRSDAEGRFRFKTVLPECYPIPHDGPVGQMLERLGRHPWRPAHLHFMIEAAGYKSLVTHVFRSDDRYLESDAVFGVRSSLVAEWKKNPAGAGPDGTAYTDGYYTLDFDFVLEPG